MGESFSQNTIEPGLWKDARLLYVEGAPAAEFLQGYLTSDTRKLVHGKAQPTALCNVQGRVLVNGWAIPLQEGVGLLVHASLFDATVGFLRPFITFAKCTLREEPGWIGINTPHADITLFDDIAIEILDTPPDDATDISTQILKRLVTAHTALVSAPVSEQFLPQMLALEETGAVDFDKGCYLGQEIVARAQFRGRIKRKLQTFSWQDTLPEIGADTHNGAVIVNVADDGRGLCVARVKSS